MADEFILFSQSLVNTIKRMCRSGLSCAQGYRIILTGSLRVNIDPVSNFVIQFNEAIPADCISIPAIDSDCEEVVDLTEDNLISNTQITPWVVSASTQTLSPVMKVGRTQTAGPILRASASQTLLPRPCKEAESQTMMPFPKQNSFTQTTDIIPVDVLVQTDVLSQLPPFVYTDIAEDSNVSDLPFTDSEKWKCHFSGCNHSGDSGIELAEHYTLQHHSFWCDSNNDDVSTKPPSTSRAPEISSQRATAANCSSKKSKDTKLPATTSRRSIVTPLSPRIKSNDGKAYRCNRCHTRFVTTRGLRAHVRMVHQL